MQIRRLFQALLMPLLLMIVFICIILSGKTLAPTDIFAASQPLYQFGNASKIKNGYLTDIVDVYLPWKFYFYEYKPSSCSTELAIGSGTVLGITMPDSSCYPIQAVRNYLRYDVFQVFSKLFTFFTAYDLSYLALLLLIYCSYYFFISVLLNISIGGSPWIPAICATFATLSFPIARDIQYDGLSQALPWVLLALAFAIGKDTNQSRKKIYAWASFSCLTIAGLRSSLQAYGFVYLFFTLFFIIWNYSSGKKLSKKSYVNESLLVLSSLIIGFIYNKPAIDLFILNRSAYLPDVIGTPLIFSLKRALVWVLSFVQFFIGDLFFGFNTVDWTKVVQPLGAREYYSYDNISFFISPIIAFLSVVYFSKSENWKKNSKLIKFILYVAVIDLVLVIFPTYRIFYFRFHVWWLLTAATIVTAFILRDIESENLKIKFKIPFLYFSSLLILGFLFSILISYKTEFILSIIDHKGMFGFENGFWAERVRSLIARAQFREFYSIVFLVTIPLFILSLKNRYYRTLTLLIVFCSGLLLNIFHYNSIQEREIFSQFRNVLLKDISQFNSEQSGRHLPGNVLLLINKPTGSLYESLSLPKSNH